jgi:phage-related tail fiber protein
MADTITLRTSTERDVVKIVERGPQGPAGGGGGSGTVTSVALASSDLTITGSPITTSGTITANLANSGATAGTYTKVTVDAKGRVTAGAAATAADVGAAATAHTHVAADVTDLSLNKVPEARQTYNITSTNSAAPTEVDAQSAFQTASGSIDCVIVLNNTTGIVYADIVVPDILGTSGSQRGRVIIEATTSGGGDITNFRINAEGTSIYPATGYDEIQPTERLVLVWTGDNWNFESLHTASSPVRISLPSYAGTLPAYANSVPTTPTSNGSPGMLFYSVAQDRLYICVATNTWRRIPIATW